MSRNSLSVSWRADDEVNVSHLLVVEHQSVSEKQQVIINELMSQNTNLCRRPQSTDSLFYIMKLHFYIHQASHII